jgi:hypothetical protein
MRASLCLGLIAFGLIAAGIRVSPATPPRAGGTPRGAPPAAHDRRAPVLEATWVEEGYYPLNADETREDAAKKAQDDALNRAQAAVVRHLRLNWSPGAEQLVQAGMVRLEGAPAERKTDKGDVILARARVEITPQSRARVEDLARQHRSQLRHFLLARVFAGLVVLFVVVAGYLRLEDLTRGYYTRLLRLVALAVLAVTIAALAVVA